MLINFSKNNTATEIEIPEALDTGNPDKNFSTYIIKAFLGQH